LVACGASRFGHAQIYRKNQKSIYRTN
jgi:hypothetical protein